MQKMDAVTKELARYVVSETHFSEEAYDTAAAAIADALGCAILALNFPACTKLLGPTVAGTEVFGGCRIPGTSFCLDPVVGAFNLGAMIRWLDYNDTWLAAEWGHPSDNLGAILALGDYLARSGRCQLTMRQIMDLTIKAYEIQGVLALSNSFNRVGFDHVILVKAASAAIAAKMLGGDEEQVAAALSEVWVDVGPLRCYRHAPNTGSRKSWAAGDAAARGVQLALLTMRGERGYPTALSAERFGMEAVVFGGQALTLEQPLGSYVMENILFKISYPAEFHGQTAVEAAVALHSSIGERIADIRQIQIATHESALRIIDKDGPLNNPADRDHCIQYMVAVALLNGKLGADDYEDSAASDPRIDRLREKMRLREELSYSRDYLDPDKRSIANAVTVVFADGTSLTKEVEYPLGHRRRRVEGLPKLYKKFSQNLSTRFSSEAVEEMVAIFQNRSRLENFTIDALIEQLMI